MAIPIEVVVSYEDQAGKSSKNQMYIANGLSIAQYTTFLRAAAVIIDTVTAALITAINFVVSVDISALTGNTIALSSDVEEIGSFKIETAAGRPVNLNIPAILDGLNVPGTDDLDLNHELIYPIFSMIIIGIEIENLMGPSDINGEDADRLISAKYEVRNSGRKK